MTDKNCITVSKGVQCSSLFDGVSLREAAGLVPLAEPKQEANTSWMRIPRVMLKIWRWRPGWLRLWSLWRGGRRKQWRRSGLWKRDPSTHCYSSRGRAAVPGCWVLASQASWEMWDLWQSMHVIIELYKGNYGRDKITMHLWTCLWVGEPTVFEWDAMV